LEDELRARLSEGKRLQKDGKRNAVLCLPCGLVHFYPQTVPARRFERVAHLSVGHLQSLPWCGVRPLGLEPACSIAGNRRRLVQERPIRLKDASDVFEPAVDLNPEPSQAWTSRGIAGVPQRERTE